MIKLIKIVFTALILVGIAGLLYVKLFTGTNSAVISLCANMQRPFSEYYYVNVYSPRHDANNILNAELETNIKYTVN